MQICQAIQLYCAEPSVSTSSGILIEQAQKLPLGTLSKLSLKGAVNKFDGLKICFGEGTFKLFSAVRYKFLEKVAISTVLATFDLTI